MLEQPRTEHYQLTQVSEFGIDLRFSRLNFTKHQDKKFDKVDVCCANFPISSQVRWNLTTHGLAPYRDNPSQCFSVLEKNGVRISWDVAALRHLQIVVFSCCLKNLIWKGLTVPLYIVTFLLDHGTAFWFIVALCDTPWVVLIWWHASDSEWPLLWRQQRGWGGAIYGCNVIKAGANPHKLPLSQR